MAGTAGTAGTADTSGRQHLETRLPPTPESIAEARRFAAEALRLLGAADRADEVRLLVSELATNVVLHARTPMEIRVARLNGLVEIAVSDRAPDRVVRRGAKRSAVGGRGMMLVESFAAEWGVDVRDGSKCVWFRMAA